MNIRTFHYAHAAAEQAAMATSLMDTGGWDSADHEAERLAGEALEAWRPVATAIAAGIPVDEMTRRIGRRYPRHIDHAAAHAMVSPATSIGHMDWSRGRGQ
jgi:hypothetical protein